MMRCFGSPHDRSSRQMCLGSAGWTGITCCLVDFLHDVYLVAVQNHISPVAAPTEDSADIIHLYFQIDRILPPHDCILKWC